MRLPFRTRTGYGAADFGLSAAELLLQLYLLEFYISAVGLPPYLAGIGLAVAVLWDAVSDPLMGALLDHTQTRWGRFNPYLLGGSLLFGMGLVLLFAPPNWESHWLLTAYLIGAYLVVNTGMTIMGVPHLALGAVLSPDTHERTELYGWRLGFGTTGLFFGILAPLLAARISGLDVATSEGLAASRFEGAVWVCAVLIIFTLITLVTTGKQSRDLPPPEGTFGWKQVWEGSRVVMTNPLFLPIFLAFLLVAGGRAMNATLALPYYKVSLNLPESDIQGPILGVFTLCIVLSVPFWLKLARKLGKKRPALAGMWTLGGMTCIVYPLLPSGSVAGPVGAAILGGFAVGAVILFESLVTDISRRDQTCSGENREGLYFGYWRMGQKLTRSVMLALTGVLLTFIGYDASLPEQTEATARRLAWVFGPGVGVLFLLASLIFARLDEKSLQSSISE